MSFNRDAIVKVATVVGLVIAIGGWSEARHSGKQCWNADYYSSHKRWCDAYEAVRLGIRRTYARTDVVQTQPSEQVTVYRDRQANTEVGQPDQFVALQTAEDARSGPTFGYLGGWLLSAFDLGKHPVARRVAAAPPPVRTVTTKTVTTRTVTTVVAER